VLGLLSCHSNGYVREAAVRELASVVNGGEIPFLALRTNDWVWHVAERAAEILSRRINIENQKPIAEAYPFLVRMLAQQRRDHRRFGALIQAVTTANNGQILLSCLGRFDTWTRRQAFKMLLTGSLTTKDPAVRAALRDHDPLIRLNVIEFLESGADRNALVGLIDELFLTDPVSRVRSRILEKLTVFAPERARALIPDALLDRSATVRDLARFLVGKLDVQIVPRDVYVNALKSKPPRQLSVAIIGVGETGTKEDIAKLLTHANHPAPCVRRAVCRATLQLDIATGIDLVSVRVTDPSPSVLRTCCKYLIANSRKANFNALHSQLKGIQNPESRRKLITVLAHAPKWDAVFFLLDALDDSAPEVRSMAKELLNSWNQSYNRSQVPPDQARLIQIKNLLERHQSEISRSTRELLQLSLTKMGQVAREKQCLERFGKTIVVFIGMDDIVS
jgi:hypothetical protein